jgi:hypothetical protein
MSTTEIIREIRKEKDHWKFMAEFSDNAKSVEQGEPQVTVKAHSETSLKEAVDLAKSEYLRAKKKGGRK